jgi:hypothetical protein
MKRPALALSAGILLVALLPGVTTAKTTTMPGALDESNAPGVATTSFADYNDFAQTFTAGQTGLLTGVELDLEGTGHAVVNLVQTDASGNPNYETASTMAEVELTLDSPDDYAWTAFVLPDPQPVIANDEYAIVLSHEKGSSFSAAGSGDTYSGGQALTTDDGTAWTSVSADLADFAFHTYMDPQTTTLAWSTPSVVAGTTASLTLTEKIVFPTYAGPQPFVAGVTPDAPPDVIWTVKADSFPAWFTPTGISCAGQIATGDCTLANVAPGVSMPVTPDGNPISITLTLTGTASPALTDVGTATGKAEGCADYTNLYVTAGAEPNAGSLTSCVAGQGVVTVSAPTPAQTAAPSPTPPPTSTGDSPSSGRTGSTIWLLPFGLLGLISAAGVLVRRRPGRIG